MSLTPLILIAETGEKDRRILAEVCEASGYRALAVDSATLMMGALRRRPADLILLSGRLPLSAQEDHATPTLAALALLRGDPDFRGTPVLVGLESDAQKEAAEQALLAGADDVIYKPYRPHEVGQRLRNTVRRIFVERREQAQSEDQTWLHSLSRSGSIEQMRATLDHEVLRATRFGRALACLVVRIGGARAAHGYASLAIGLKKRVRNVDMLFLGQSQHEFVLVLPETSADQASTLRARIAEAFYEGTLAGLSRDSCTLEMGIAGVPQVLPRDGIELYRAAANKLVAC